LAWGAGDWNYLEKIQAPRSKHQGRSKFKIGKGRRLAEQAADGRDLVREEKTEDEAERAGDGDGNSFDASIFRM
jgi:hypothetical protein